MSIKEYFEQNKGYGVLATAGSSGKVNAAIYSKPYIIDENTVAFIMAERLTNENIKFNSWAAYLFIEAGGGYSGKRLYLKRTREEENVELASQICRQCDYSLYETGNRYVTYFNIEKVLPLVGE
jgi:hypothetical protein